MSQMQSQSYRHIEVVGLTLRHLSSGLAVCADTFVRFNTDNKEIARLGFTYTMRNEESWKIIVAALHEPVVV